MALGTCNISRSASRVFTNVMLYYDFGSGAIAAANCVHPLLGIWGPHEKLFISTYGAEDLKVFDMPADRKIISPSVATGTGEAVGKTWAFPEWSTHPYFAVANLLVDRLFLVSGNYQHTMNAESIYLISLKDSSYVKLAETTDTSYASKTTLGIHSFGWMCPRVKTVTGTEVLGGFTAGLSPYNLGDVKSWRCVIGPGSFGPAGTVVG